MEVSETIGAACWLQQTSDTVKDFDISEKPSFVLCASGWPRESRCQSLSYPGNASIVFFFLAIWKIDSDAD